MYGLELFIKIAVPIMTVVIIPMIGWAYSTNTRLVRVEARDDSEVKRRLDRLETKIDDLTTFLLRVHNRDHDLDRTRRS